MRVEVVEGRQLESPTIREEIAAVAAPSYVDASALLRREWADCDRAYVGRDEDGRMCCFFLTGCHTLDIGGEILDAVHLGLSAARIDKKRTGLAARLYAACVEHVREREARDGARRLLWSTTASPTVFLAVSRYLTQPEPHMDGSFSHFGRCVAVAVRKRLHAPPPSAGDHPFVLRGIATGTRYSEHEAARIRAVQCKTRFDLFDRLDIVESREDRLLFIARAPKHSTASGKPGSTI